MQAESQEKVRQGQPSNQAGRVRRDKSRIDWKKLESKWQRRWTESKIFETDPKPGMKKFFVTVAYPYVNSPQHIGHARTYTMGDVDARYHRMRGFNTLLPIGFHYTGTPIAAMSKRLSQGDPEITETFRNVYHVPESKIVEMGDPYRLARYFHQEIRTGMKEIGFSIDWRREFSTVDPIYKRFVQWQFQRLRDNGRITRGTHPVGWCPNDNNPVGMHDTMGDMEPEIGEYYLIKFEMEGVVLPTATLRPETIYGVTNLWINPEATYVQADVDGETWIISRDTVPKLQHQNRKVTIEHEISGKDLVGRSIYNPIVRMNIPILPGRFVNPKNGTGLVMSVPAHAPYDYQALEDLRTNPPDG
ncbi:MAG TPA: class I tRNA ligase family protein, partial [Candidatus Binatus sp.]|nr:class I tRNA ligase family protein [Candidatus Binatus sp.]